MYQNRHEPRPTAYVCMPSALLLLTACRAGAGEAQAIPEPLSTVPDKVNSTSRIGFIVTPLVKLLSWPGSSKVGRVGEPEALPTMSRR